MIGGNLTATIQLKSPNTNNIGEVINDWTDYATIKGYLDLLSGTSTKSHNTKTVEASNVFISDYNELVRNLDTSKCRLMINHRVYEIKFIDDPMELHDHLEITLNLLGIAND